MSAGSAAFCISGENGNVNSPDRFMDEVERQGVLPQPLSPRLTGDHWEDGKPTILTKDNFYSLCEVCLLPLWDPTWWSAGGEHQGAGRRSWSIGLRERRGRWSLHQWHRAESNTRWCRSFEPTQILRHSFHFHFFLAHKMEIWESLRKVEGHFDFEGQLGLQLWTLAVCWSGMSSLAIVQGWGRGEMKLHTFEKCKP